MGDNFNNLAQALQMFDTSVNKTAQTAAVFNANNQVKQLQAQMVSMDPNADVGNGQTAGGMARQQQEQIANSLKARLAGMGASGTTIQGAVEGVGPKEYANADAAQIGGALNKFGDPGKAAAAVAGDNQKLERQKMSYENQLRLQQIEAQGNIQKEIAGLKVNGKQTKPIPAPQLEKIQGLDSRLEEAKALLAEVTNNEKSRSFLGPVKGLDPTGLRAKLTDPEFGAFKARTERFFDSYRKDITGAAAGDKELALLETRQPRMNEDPKAYEEKLRDIISVGERVKIKRLENMKRAGFNLGDLDPAANPALAAPAATPPAAPADPAQQLTAMLSRMPPNHPRRAEVEALLQSAKQPGKQ